MSKKFHYFKNKHKSASKKQVGR